MMIIEKLNAGLSIVIYVILYDIIVSFLSVLVLNIAAYIYIALI